ncbi:MAG: hypothetical protein P9L94_13030 [Candidatus Hinthialibacter antarcticus]|nr:hypothetical protein [Candidatus Hinthialibacter antarcticus]
MKRKYIIEASIAGVVLAIIFALTIPHFLHVQAQGKAAAMQAFGNQIIDSIVKDKTHLHQLMNKMSQGQVFEGSSTYHQRNASRGQHYSKTYGIYIENNFVADVFPDIEKLNWDYSNIGISVVCAYPYESNGIKHESDFEQEPFLVWVAICVGRELKFPPRKFFNVEVGDDEFMQLNRTHIPYSPSNGLDSYGEFLSSTEPFWPKKKPAFMEPSPEDE